MLIPVRDSLPSEMSGDFRTGCSVSFVSAIITAVNVKCEFIKVLCEHGAKIVLVYLVCFFFCHWS